MRCPQAIHVILLIAEISAPKDPAAWVAVGFGILLMTYLLLRSRGKKRDPLDNRLPRMSLSQQRSVEQQMQNLLVELNEMARQITAQLDTRANKLEMLIKEADETLARLQAARAEPVVKASPRESSIDQLGPVERTSDPRHAEIYTLSDQGLAPPDIASRLSRPRGEVELILALRR